jgi:UDP-N-acetylglucosamine--N-acetylmuramyl-(pentapeptide) pyrophosphoryl-undecaprenol N-acetylglucosamine transferase
MQTSSPHILLTGGGTLGPVTPLLAIVAEWRKRDPQVKFSWVGTGDGPERTLVELAKIPFFSLSAPKFDRTRPWTWIVAPFHLVASTLQAGRILARLEPTFVITAGAYVSVPVAFAAAVMRIPLWVHQLDMVVGLANKLMAPFATRVSVTWEENAVSFGKEKSIVVGAMIRPFLRLGDAQTARELFVLAKDKPTVLVIGGGTGAASMNEMFAIIGAELVRHANVIHLTGRGKMISALEQIGDGYVAREFMGEGIADALAVSDIVVCRAGMGTIAEMVALGKPTILIPLPGHQEVNAKALVDRGAAEILTRLTPQTLLQSILRLIDHPERREVLSMKIRTVFPTNGDERIVHEAIRLLAERE